MDERNITFMFYGLAVAWGLLAVYAVLLGLRQWAANTRMRGPWRMEEKKKRTAGK